MLRFFCRDTFVEQELVFYFRDRAAFDGGGMGNNGIEIEFLVIYLFRDTRFIVFFE